MVIWTEPALSDLKGIFDYIARDSRTYATNVISTLTKKAELLDAYPDMGRTIPEKPNASHREIIVLSYRIVYRVESSDTYIIAVIHSKQDYAPTLEGKLVSKGKKDSTH